MSQQKNKRPARGRGSHIDQASRIPVPRFAKPAGAALPPLGAMMLAGWSLGASADEARKSAEDEKLMATVNVSADADIPQDGLRATVTRVGKTLQDPHDIPQAVTTVTNKLMEEQQGAACAKHCATSRA